MGPTTAAPATPKEPPVLPPRSTSRAALGQTRTWCLRLPRHTSMLPSQPHAGRQARLTFLPSQAARPRRRRHSLQLRHSSPTLILDRPTAQHAPAPARASLAPPAAPTTSSPPWRPSSTPESLEWIPSASLPRRPTLMPRSPTTPTRTLSPAQPLPTLLPSTPPPELGRDV